MVLPATIQLLGGGATAIWIKCYNPADRRKRKQTWNATTNPEGRWRKSGYEELGARDKTSLDVFWLRDKSLADLDNLPDPDELAEEIIENLEAGLNSFGEVLAGLARTS
jgi:type I restriction enzyme M protein